jgi:hypothetical protein
MPDGNEIIRQRTMVKGLVVGPLKRQLYEVLERAVGVTRKSEWHTIARDLSKIEALSLLRFADG